MTKYFWGKFATYMGKYASNKKKVKFVDGNSSFSKKSVKGLKKKTAFFLKNSSQRCASSKTDIFWRLLGHQKLSRKKGNSLMPKASFQLSND